MKILHIIPNLKKGGAERLVTDIVRELKTRPEIQVRLVIFREEIEYKVEDLRDILHIIPSSVQLSLWKKNKLHVKQLQAFIDGFQPDIIHSHLFEAEIVSRSCFYPQAKWFSHGHDNIRALNPNTAKQKGIKEHLVAKYDKNYLIKRYKLNSGTHFIVISRDTEGFFHKYGWGMPVSKIENAICYKKFKEKSEKELTEEQLNLISVGSLNQNKNHQFLVQVLALIVSKNQKVRLSLAGDGAEKDSLVNLANELNVLQNIVFLGKVEQIENYYAQSNLYVHAAKSEAFGLTLIEAMAAGLPVITLDGGGNRDLIEEGKNGYMIFEENPQLFADKISELWKNQEKYKAMSQYAKQYAKQYDIKPYVDKLLALYQST
jgi:glycosyltransferase involved in cell wall biosynthesis